MAGSPAATGPLAQEAAQVVGYLAATAPSAQVVVNKVELVGATVPLAREGVWVVACVAVKEAAEWEAEWKAAVAVALMEPVIVVVPVVERSVARGVERNRPDSPCSSRTQGIWKPMVRYASHTTKGKAGVAAREGQVGGAAEVAVWAAEAMVEAEVVELMAMEVAAVVAGACKGEGRVDGTAEVGRVEA